MDASDVLAAIFILAILGFLPTMSYCNRESEREQAAFQRCMDSAGVKGKTGTELEQIISACKEAAE